jgi:Stress responsive A/B Barrel Domain
MFLHIVLFRPKPGISESDRQAMLDALRVASTEIPSVKRFQIGARITHGGAYEKLMTEDYPYAAVIELEDVEGLKRYLEHPKHEEVGKLFYELLDRGLVYDYEMSDP